MPYVPSEKTDGKSQDRKLIDAEVKKVVRLLVKDCKESIEIFNGFYNLMRSVCAAIRAREDYLHCDGVNMRNINQLLGLTIYEVAQKYNYDGAWLGELNYATTRIIQEIPKALVKKGLMKSELRYWYYAEVVGYLGALVHYFQDIHLTNWIDQGFAGVFEDVKDEYKRRVNTAYEAAQIVKSGDCYDTPYYTKLIEIVDKHGRHIGYQEVMLKRTKGTLKLDVIGKAELLSKYFKTEGET